jgi:hypothetical protein
MTSPIASSTCSSPATVLRTDDGLPEVAEVVPEVLGWSNGINATTGKSGYELNLALGFLALVIAFFGAGRFSIDALLARRLAAAEPSAIS